jgi:outer membrane scaffolding protein for murein synthesis (MipA/OmpV family)
MRLTLAASCFCAALASAWPADAGQAEGPGRQAQLAENIDDAPTFGFDFWPDILDPREWDLTLGVVGGVVPDFPGADSYSFRATPHVRIVWHDRLFVKNETAGVNLIKTRDLKLGLSVNDLAGLGEVGDGVEAGGFLRVDRGRLRLHLQFHHDVASGHGGTLVKLGASTRLRLAGRAWGRVKAEATLASAPYMRAFFGVDARQSADSGLPEHAPGTGVKDLAISLSSGYDLTDHWSVGGVAGYSRLLGGAADSPIVRERGSPDQFVAGLGLFYRF